MRYTARPVRSTIASTLLMLAACGQDSAPTESYSGTLYPGASLVFAVSPTEPLHARTDIGEFFTYLGDDYALYVAPLENGTDRYAIESAEGSRVIARGEVVVDMAPSADIESLESDNRTQAAGRYGPVEFSVSASDDATARATYVVDGRELKVSIGGGRGRIEWNGLTLDGFGELGDDEAAALREISTGPFARALTMVSLDLGCREEAYGLPLSAYAALIFPWQMILKYEIVDRGYVIPYFLLQSRCSFSGLPDPAGEKPINGSIMWDRVYAIPMTPFLFPFDGAGQLGDTDGG